MAVVSGDSGAWIRRFHPAPDASTRLICFPHAGGSATYYFPVSRAMSPAVEVLAIQYPGRQDRRAEPCVDDLGQLADAVTRVVRPWLDRPFTLFGHSMGAMLGFEVARRLEADGVVSLGLFASGRRAPSRHRVESTHLAGDDELIAQMAQLSGTDSALLGDEEMLRMILPAVRGDYKAVETYRYQPGPPLSCPIIALTGDNDPQVTLQEAASWDAHTSGRFELRIFPGGHFYLNSHAPAVIKSIIDHIDTASASPMCK